MRTFSTSIALLLAGAVAAAPGHAAPAASGQAKVRTAARVGGLPPGTQRPTREVLLSVGQGELVTLPANVTDVWVSNSSVADVYVRSARQINLFGKEFGESTIFATGPGGQVIYSANIRVSQNLTSVDRMLKAAMPDADVKVTTMGQIAVLTGTVATPDDAAQAKELVTAVLNPGVDVSAPGAALKIGVISRIKTATPLQVNLQVRIAEVSRSFIKNVGANVLTRDNTGGFNFGLFSGRANAGTIGPRSFSGYPTRDFSPRFNLPAGTIPALPFDPRNPDVPLDPVNSTQYTIGRGAQRTTLGLAGKLLGLDVLSALDLGETIGQVSMLANPNLTALSGETASFLVGGEVPIPIAQALGTLSVEYKQYGISLSYTPTVLADGRISLRVRPEVSELSLAGAVQLNNVTIPAFSTRRAETTLEMGSGQSMMIGGLISNRHDNQIEKTPGIADLPILGALFRSNAWQRNETELVIIITPYLVKPVNTQGELMLPSDGYKAPTDLGRVLLGNLGGGVSGEKRPVPTVAPASAAPPVIGATAPVGPRPIVPQPAADRGSAAGVRPAGEKKKGTSLPAPGFSN